jgi:excisionase family DNA binding protein
VSGRDADWPEPLTVREVSAELGCSEGEVRALVRAGELKSVACGIRPGLVPRHELDDYLRRQRREPSKSA